MNGPEKRWTLKLQLTDLMLVLQRPFESAAQWSHPGSVLAIAQLDKTPTICWREVEEVGRVGRDFREAGVEIRRYF